MFGIKGRNTFNKPFTTDRTKFVRMAKEKWIRFFPFFLFFAMIVSVFFVMYVWYMHVYTKELTESESEKYINQKRHEVTFRKKKFDRAKDILNARKEHFDGAYVNKEDVFYHTERVVEQKEGGEQLEKDE